MEEEDSAQVTEERKEIDSEQENLQESEEESVGNEEESESEVELEGDEMEDNQFENNEVEDTEMICNEVEEDNQEEGSDIENNQSEGEDSEEDQVNAVNEEEGVNSEVEEIVESMDGENSEDPDIENEVIELEDNEDENSVNDGEVSSVCNDKSKTEYNEDLESSEGEEISEINCTVVDNDENLDRKEDNSDSDSSSCISTTNISKKYSPSKKHEEGIVQDVSEINDDILNPIDDLNDADKELIENEEELVQNDDALDPNFIINNESSVELTTRPKRDLKRKSSSLADGVDSKSNKSSIDSKPKKSQYENAPKFICLICNSWNEKSKFCSSCCPGSSFVQSNCSTKLPKVGLIPVNSILQSINFPPAVRPESPDQLDPIISLEEILNPASNSNLFTSNLCNELSLYINGLPMPNYFSASKVADTKSKLFKFCENLSPLDYLSAIQVTQKSLKRTIEINKKIEEYTTQLNSLHALKPFHPELVSRFDSTIADVSRMIEVERSKLMSQM